MIFTWGIELLLLWGLNLAIGGGGQFGLWAAVTGLIDAVVGAGDTPWLKPEAALTAHALALLGAPAAGAVLVGDSPFDIQAAHNGGIPAWVVTTGTHDGAALGAAGANRIFLDLASIGREFTP